MSAIGERLCNFVKASPEPRFDYHVDLESKRLIINSNHLTARLSTILGSPGDSKVEISIEDAHKLPHDLVHIAISAEPERTLPGSILTPDIQLEDGSVIEIATRSTHTTRSLKTAIAEKQAKYGDVVENLCVIAVNFNFCLCTHQIDDETMAKLIRYYREGVKMMKSLLVPLGVTRVDPSSLSGLQQAPPVMRDDFFSIPALNTSKPKLKEMSWRAYLESFNKEETRLKKTVVHLPMFSLSREDTINDLYPTIDGWKSELVSSVIRLKPQHIERWDEVEKKEMRKYPVKQLQKNKHPDSYPDQICLKLSKDEKIELAMRGVRAKKFRHEPLIIANRLRHKLPVSKDSSTAQIDSFVNEKDVARNNPPMQEYDVRFAGVQCLFQECLENLELMLREVALNATRRCANNQFIVRKLLRMPCFVVSCNTSYSSPHDKPSFFAVIAKGSPYKPELFGEWEFIGNDWWFYNFVSTDRRRMEHLVGLPEQSLALRALIEEQLGDLSPSMSWNISLEKTWKIMMLILLTDNTNLSLTLQNLRYYYMELFSGSDPQRSLKILDRMPATCRSIMQLWVVKELSIHHPISKLPHIRDQDDDENDLTGRSQDDLPSLQTPFQFSITSLDTMLLASYMCMLKNKDEQNQGHDSKTIFKKTLKREYEYQDRKLESKHLDCICEKDASNQYRTFEASGEAIRLGANLVKRTINTHIGESSWNSSFKDLLWSRIRKETMNTLFSTKSSSTEDANSVDPELINYDKRSKVFLKLLEIQDKFSSELLFNCYDDWIGLVKTCVSMFKKNQIGGVREIYILNFSFRLAVKYVEDISRAICMGHPCESLTKSNLKDDFVQRHFEDCKQKMTQDCEIMTLRVSSDMTHWANLMMTDFFRTMFQSLLPKNLLDKVCTILDLHDKKKLYMPRPLIESFYKTTNADSFIDEGLNRLRKEFLGLTDPLITKRHQPWISCETNMMQGILHYTSSLYHLCHLEVLKRKVSELATELKLQHHMSFIVSSDDEGILITLGNPDKSSLTSKGSAFCSRFKSLKNSVDSLFGVRTSWEKSTTTIREIFEFNSIFKIRNTFGSPLIKFVARSVDDNVSETLNSRVRAMHQQLRTIRESGGSGALCSMISTLQSRLLRRNLGETMMGWFSSDWYNSIPNFSFFGKMIDPGPCLSGLVSIEYQNWLVCHENPSLLGKFKRYGFSVYVDSEDKEHSMSFRMFPRTKFIEALRKAGLKPKIDLSDDDVRVVMSRTRSLSDMRRLNEIRASSPGIAASFCYLARTDNVRASAYLLTAPLFDGKTFREFVLEDVKSEGSLTDLFPDHFEFLMMQNMNDEPKAFIKSPHKKAKRFKYYFPVLDQHEHRKRAPQILSKLWFNDELTGLSDLHYNRLLHKLKNDLPWIRPSLKESLIVSPFINYYSMLSMIEQITKHTKPWKLLSVTGRGRQSLSEVYALNTYPNYTTIVEHVQHHQKTYDWMQLENRVAAWSALIPNERSPPDCVTIDILNTAERVPDSVLREAMSTAKRDSRKLARFVHVMRLHDPTLQSYVNIMENAEKVWLVEQWFNNQTGEYEGKGIFVTKHEQMVIKVIINGREIVEVESLLSHHQVLTFLHMSGLVSSSHMRFLNIEPYFNQEVMLSYSSGVRLLVDNGTQHPGSTGRVFGCRHSITGNVHFAEGDLLDVVIDAYLNNTVVPLDYIRLFLESNSELKTHLAKAIKEVRSGTTLIRLSERIVPSEVEMDPVFSVQEEKFDEGIDLDELILNIGLEVEDEFDPENFILHEVKTLEVIADRERDHVQLIMGRMLYKYASTINSMVESGSVITSLHCMCTEREVRHLSEAKRVPERPESKFSRLIRRFRRR